ncbi:MAG: cytidylate kinase [Granulosicoccus sp.]|jgi:cytidylate kinase
MANITIAIDGYSSCGKSTMAKALAKQLGYVYVDSGAMYRAITLHCIRNGWVSKTHLDQEEIIASLDDVSISFSFNEEEGRSRTLLNKEDVEEEIRTMAVSQLVSQVSVIREVRLFMQNIQHAMGQNGGVVMDGRDIGTAVFPNAELKIFMTADPKIRAQRRFDEISAKGQAITLEEVNANLQGRDYEDTHRKENPLIQAEDAEILDNSELNQDQQLSVAIGWVREQIQ